MAEAVVALLAAVEDGIVDWIGSEYLVHDHTQHALRYGQSLHHAFILASTPRMPDGFTISTKMSNRKA